MNLKDDAEDQVDKAEEVISEQMENAESELHEKKGELEGRIKQFKDDHDEDGE